MGSKYGNLLYLNCGREDPADADTANHLLGEWERRPRWQRRWINEGDVVIGCFLCVTVFHKQTFVRCPLIFGDSVIQVFMFSEL